MKNVRNADGTQPTTTDMQLMRGTNFVTVFDGSSYNFVVTSTKRPTQNNLSYNYNNVEIVQGTYAQDSFIFDNQIANPKFVLSNERVDKSRMIVSVTSNGVAETYTLSTGISNITTESKVYYAQENEEGYVEIYFGDGTLGKSLSDGDIIDVTYIIVDEVHANGASQFV